MGYLCDFCGEQRSIVYCRSDAASLCLSCDRNVHSANALSKRHSRTLVCERCNSQPAFIRCIEERASLCQNCDWIGHTGSSMSSAHKKQAVNCYSGCPSAAELSEIWSFLLDLPSVEDSTCEQGMGSMRITDDRPRNNQDPHEKCNFPDSSFVIKTSDQDNANEDESRVWKSSSTPLLDPGLHNPDHAGCTSSSVPKAFACPDDAFYDDFIMDEVDLSIENYEELFGGALNDPDQLFDNDEIEELFGTKDLSGSNCQMSYTAEGSLIGGGNTMRPGCSAASADSFMSNKTEPNLCFKRQAHSGLSFSGITGESSAGDNNQDCGASSMLIMGEPPWCPPGPESSMPSTSRSDAVLRYKEKKKARKFDKKVRYASRKARADVRRRVKGRFVKAGEAYDYDPLSQSRSC